ncbi:MAG TPA: DsrH/TusB family sulfur metabolism protein [Nitrospirota bacterium]|nr:DsrH/TusB family sulfur metabolism protein [Nitrospirota bacterium]
MIVMIKSGPDTTDGASGVTLAKVGGADIVLLQNGVYFARKDRLGPFAGAVYVLDDDKRLRGLKDSEMDARVKTIDYDKLTDIITGGENVVGMF